MDYTPSLVLWITKLTMCINCTVITCQVCGSIRALWCVVCVVCVCGVCVCVCVGGGGGGGSPSLADIAGTQSSPPDVCNCNYPHTLTVAGQ